jgi:2'-5' RNA ligase
MIKSFTQFVNEKQATYDYGCVMLYTDFPNMENLHSQIEEEDVYINPDDSTFGLETEPHITLLYGLHDGVSLEDVKGVIEKHQFGELIAYNVSMFDNPKYDVLKFDIRYPNKGGAFLHKCNEDLKLFPFTTQFPEYHPHMTIAYIKKGMGQKYVDLFQGQEWPLTPTNVVYSMANGEKPTIEINETPPQV